MALITNIGRAFDFSSLTTTGSFDFSLASQIKPKSADWYQHIKYEYMYHELEKNIPKFRSDLMYEHNKDRLELYKQQIREKATKSWVTLPNKTVQITLLHHPNMMADGKWEVPVGMCDVYDTRKNKKDSIDKIHISELPKNVLKLYRELINSDNFAAVQVSGDYKWIAAIDRSKNIRATWDFWLIT